MRLPGWWQSNPAPARSLGCTTVAVVAPRRAPSGRIEGKGYLHYLERMQPEFIQQLRSARVPLYLAPQAGVSESPFRRLCRGFGADVVVSEFVSSEGIRRHDKRTHEYLR